MSGHAAPCVSCGAMVTVPASTRPRRWCCEWCGGTAHRWHEHTEPDHGGPVLLHTAPDQSSQRYQVGDAAVMHWREDNGVRCTSCPRVSARSCVHALTLRAWLDGDATDESGDESGDEWTAATHRRRSAEGTRGERPTDQDHRTEGEGETVPHASAGLVFREGAR